MVRRARTYAGILLALSILVAVATPILLARPSPTQFIYSLIVGDRDSFGHSLFAFDGYRLQPIAIPTKANLTDIKWRHDGRYALISGTNGTLLKYDGTSFDEIAPSELGPGANPNTISFRSISWSPDDSQALIVGTNRTFETPQSNVTTSHGVIYKFDGHSLTRLRNDKFLGYNSVEWNPDGSYALLVGYSTQNFFHSYGARFDRLEHPSDLHMPGNDSLNTVEWHLNPTFALIGGDVSNEAKNATLYMYDGNKVTLLPTAESTNPSCCFLNDAHIIRYIVFSDDTGEGFIVGNKGLVILIDPQGNMTRIRNFTSLDGRVGDLHHLADLYSARWAPGEETIYALGTNSTIVKISQTTVSLLTQACLPVTVEHPCSPVVFRSISMVVSHTAFTNDRATLRAYWSNNPPSNAALLVSFFASTWSAYFVSTWSRYLAWIWSAYSGLLVLAFMVAVLAAVFKYGESSEAGKTVKSEPETT